MIAKALLDSVRAAVNDSQVTIYARILTQLVDEVERLQATPNWQPIETAPRDEKREILGLYAPTSECWIIVWHDYTGSWRIKSMPGRDPTSYFPATHWAPIPGSCL